jgi:hypothetical protein
VLKEQKIIEQAVRDLPVQYIDAGNKEWWMLIRSGDGETQSPETPELTIQDQTAIQLSDSSREQN